MKKSELKNIIRECVKEVIFEEGVLSGIITEVAVGLQGTIINEMQSSPKKMTSKSAKMTETKRKVLSAVGNTGYEDIKRKFSNPELFEGTKPIPSQPSKGSPLSGVAPGDPGVDISNIPGFGNWSTVMSGE
jgi:hypothetical protein